MTETQVPLKKNCRAPSSNAPRLQVGNSAGCTKRSLGIASVEIRRTIRAAVAWVELSGGEEGRRGGGWSPFVFSRLSFYARWRKNEVPWSLKEWLTSESLLIAPRDARRKINCDAQIKPQELNYIKEKGILVRCYPNKTKKWSGLFKALFDTEKTWMWK